MRCVALFTLVAVTSFATPAGAQDRNTSVLAPLDLDLRRIAADPALRSAHIALLRRSIEQLTIEHRRIDLAGPLALTITGGVLLAGGAGAAILLPLVDALVSTVFCFTACNGHISEGVLIAAGAGASAALIGLVMLVYGSGERERAVAARRPGRERLDRERRELELLETIDVVFDGDSALLTARVRF